MGSWRGADVHNIGSFGGQQFFGCCKAPHSRHNASHRSLCYIRRIRHRDQLDSNTSQDCAGMMLSMAAGAEERNAQRSRV
jgi:hypothetical protein